MFKVLQETLRNGRFGGLLERLLGRPGNLRAHLVKHTTGVFVLKVVSALLALVTSIILARLLGAAGYGIYAYVWSVITFLSIPATFGLPQLLVRNIASYQTKEEWSHIKGLLHFADRTALAASLGFAVLLGLGVRFFSNRIGTQMAHTFLIALPLLVFMALLQMRQTALQGLNRIVQGEMLISFIRPALFILLVAVAYFLFGETSPSSAMGMQVAAFGIAFLAGTLLLTKYIPKSVKESFANFERRGWVQSSLSLLLIMSFQIGNQNVDILMLGPITGNEAVGLYKVTFQSAILVSFALGAVSVAIAPTISRLHSHGEKSRLQRIVTQGTCACFFFSLPLVLVYIFAGQSVLKILFGDEFMAATTTLRLLTAGHMINLLTGPSHQVLIMTNQENKAAKGWGVAIGVNVLLNAIFIPRWGIEGAAMATLVSMTIWNALLGLYVYRAHRIYMSIFGSSLQKAVR